MRVYIAAPKALVLVARLLAKKLRELGFEVVSTWHDTMKEGASDPVWYFERVQILETNLAELSRAEVMLALTSDDAGRETYIEIGRALERGIPIAWSLERGGDALSSVAAWQTLTDAEAIAALGRYAEAGEWSDA